MSTILKDKKIAIIGGGPGGLMLARLLQQKGVDVMVYERDKDKSFRQQGATLDLHYDSGLKALKAGGLIEEFKNNFRPGADRFTITDNNAVTHYTERDNEPSHDVDSEYARPEIDRGPLRDMLIASLQDDTIVWDSKFSALRESGSGWDIVFENGTTAYADLVVAADGANSKVRKYITDMQRVYSGITIVEGNVYNGAKNAPHLWALTNGGKVFAMWGGKTIVLSAKGEGSLSFYTSTKEAEDWATASGIDFENKEEVFSWFKERFADWSADWHEIFSTDDSYFVVRPQYIIPADQSWQTLPNLTMLGDAAHQTPPSGDGVNQAMLDALELSEALCTENFDTIAEAIASFEKNMRSRIVIVNAEALELVAGMQSDNNLQFMLDFFDHIIADKNEKEAGI